MASLNKVCCDCGKSFQFTTQEQQFYQQKNYPDPKRCFPCRRAIRQPWAAAKHQAGGECFDCNPRLVRGVVVNDEDKCLACGRLIEKANGQYPVKRAA